MGWGEGYVTDVPYTFGYYDYLSPQNIDLCLLYHRIRPMGWGEGFTYCELGCGHGVTSAMLAALYPQGQFYVMDFNPIHIKYLSNLVKTAGLSNLHYANASFAEYAEDESLPNFDYISVHGVYSWISPENRCWIHRIIEKRLKLGGIVSLSYNVLPGWSMLEPIQHLMNTYQQADCTGNLFTRLQKVMEFIEKMRGNRAFYFNDFVKAKLDHIKTLNPSYLIHEYFNLDWHPMYSDQVLSEMFKLKLSYIGSANLIENIPSCILTSDAFKHISSIEDIKVQELVKDFYLNTQFRRDLYIKGGLGMSDRESRLLLSKLNFILGIERHEMKWEHQQGMVITKLEKRFCEPILDAIEKGETDLTKVYEVLQSDGLTFSTFWVSLFTLLGLGYIRLYTPNSNNVKSCSNFNEAILKRVSFGKEILYLATPHLYSGVSVNYLNLLFLYWEFMEKQQSLRDFVMENLQSVNLVLADDDGNRLDEEEAQVALLEQKYRDFVKTRRPFLERTGALEFMKRRKSGQQRRN